MAKRRSRDKDFGELQNLGPNVNAESWTESAALSSDGLTLIYGVSRPQPESADAQDLYLTTRATGSERFGPATRLPGPVNSNEWREFNPFLTADGRTLYFASSQPSGLNSDLWKVERVKRKAGKGKR
jgi:OOP family OmpA-OmpF porin